MPRALSNNCLGCGKPIRAKGTRCRDCHQREVSHDHLTTAERHVLIAKAQAEGHPWFNGRRTRKVTDATHCPDGQPHCYRLGEGANTWGTCRHCGDTRAFTPVLVDSFNQHPDANPMEATP